MEDMDYEYSTGDLDDFGLKENEEPSVSEVQSWGGQSGMFALRTGGLKGQPLTERMSPNAHNRAKRKLDLGQKGWSSPKRGERERGRSDNAADICHASPEQSLQGASNQGTFWAPPLSDVTNQTAILQRSNATYMTLGQSADPRKSCLICPEIATVGLSSGQLLNAAHHNEVQQMGAPEPPREESNAHALHISPLAEAYTSGANQMAFEFDDGAPVNPAIHGQRHNVQMSPGLWAGSSPARCGILRPLEAPAQSPLLSPHGTGTKVGPPGHGKPPRSTPVRRCLAFVSQA